eukprot:TRINITY_DN52240_c0_g1_i1.p1 TRINITY_DN52240_c0_g1~~TRINITY_DN52240_c0_g1_i1.p1  ORF type:complete len:185 (+),score=79.72 TRINITY_DN52240_c0_g1_i1:48-602(+)
MGKVLNIVVVLVAVAVGTLHWHSAFSTVKWREVENGFPGHWIVYDDHVGHFKNIGDVVVRVAAQAKELGADVDDVDIPWIGVYLSDPNVVPEEEWRSQGGVVVDEATAKKLAAAGMKTRYLEPKDAFVAEFPYVSSWSVMVGVLRVYPALGEFCKENSAEDRDSFVVERMDWDARVIRYYAIEK